MADLLYELAYEVNTSALDKAEARLKRYDDAMARSSERARRLERDISSIGGGRSSGTGVIRSSGASSGRGGSLLTSNEREIQRNMRAELRARERIDRSNDQIGQREWRRQIQIGREQRRQAADLERFNARRERAAVREATQAERERRRIFAFQERMRRQRERDDRSAASKAATRYGHFENAVGLGAAGLAGGLVGGLYMAGRGLLAFGDSALQGMGERDSSLRNYTTLMGGDRERAGLEYYRAQQFARKTDFTEGAVTKAQSGLVAQGFRGDDLYRTLFAAADLSSLSGEDKSEALAGVVRALGQIKAKGRLQAEEINQISEHAPLGRQMWMEEIRRGMGLKSLADVEKTMQKGGVSADVGLAAFQRATLTQLGTERLGQFSTQSAGSITSLLSNMQEAQQMLAKSFDSDTLPAVARFRESLTALSGQFDVSSKAGQNLSFVYKDLANTAIEAKTQIASFKAGFLDAFSSTFRQGRERNPSDLAEQAARQKDRTEQLGRNLGEAAAGAGLKLRSPTEVVSLMARDVNTYFTAWKNWRGGKAGFFDPNQRAERLPGAEDDADFGRQAYDQRFWTPLAATPYGPPTSAKETAVEKLTRLRSRGTTRTAVATPSPRGASAGSGTGGGTSSGGDDHSVRIGTQVTVQQLTVQVTVPAQPGMTPQSMSAMIGESVREALLREVGRSARRPRS